MGIGQELRGDDAAGLEIARRIHRRQRARPPAATFPLTLLAIEGGPAPENCTGTLRRFGPDLVILADAALMDEAPGAICWLDWQDTTGLSASTHSLPPYLLARYLTTELGAQVALLGIQPGQNAVGDPLSPAVRRAVAEVVAGLAGILLGPQS